MGQDLPPDGGYEPIQYKVCLSLYARKGKLTSILSATYPPVDSAQSTISSAWVQS